MKIITILCIALLANALSTNADETGYLGMNIMELAEGENLTVLWFSDTFNPDGPEKISIKIHLPPYDETVPGTVLIRESTDIAGRTFFGPCRISCKSSITIAAYKKTSRAVFTNPVNVIMIPVDYDGDVDLMVETSTDLETWTPIYSGSAGTSNSAAFFRTRLITQ